MKPHRLLMLPALALTLGGCVAVPADPYAVAYPAQPVYSPYYAYPAYPAYSYPSSSIYFGYGGGWGRGGRWR